MPEQRKTRREIREWLDEQGLSEPDRDAALAFLVGLTYFKPLSREAIETVFGAVRARPDYARLPAGGKIRILVTPDEMDDWMAAQGTAEPTRHEIRSYFQESYKTGAPIQLSTRKPTPSG